MLRIQVITAVSVQCDECGAELPALSTVDEAIAKAQQLDWYIEVRGTAITCACPLCLEGRAPETGIMAMPSDPLERLLHLKRTGKLLNRGE